MVVGLGCSGVPWYALVLGCSGAQVQVLVLALAAVVVVVVAVAVVRGVVGGFCCFCSVLFTMLVPFSICVDCSTTKQQEQRLK